MHALLAHAYHLLQSHLWRPPAAAVALALTSRVSGWPKNAALTACAASLAGWLLLDPGWATWPPNPIARLPGLALLLLAALAAPPRLRAIPVVAAAWWLHGAPGTLPGLAGCVPVLLGLAAALEAARRLAPNQAPWGPAAAALILAGGLMASGASPHWARAAVVTAFAATALAGRRDAAAALAGCVVMVAASALVASDRGRLIGVDVACLLPFGALAVAARKKAVLF